MTKYYKPEDELSISQAPPSIDEESSQSEPENIFVKYTETRDVSEYPESSQSSEYSETHTNQLQVENDNVIEPVESTEASRVIALCKFLRVKNLNYGYTSRLGSVLTITITVLIILVLYSFSFLMYMTEKNRLAQFTLDVFMKNNVENKISQGFHVGDDVNLFSNRNNDLVVGLELGNFEYGEDSIGVWLEAVTKLVD